MAYRLAVIERFAGLTVAEGKGAFWKQKPPIDPDQAGFCKVWRWPRPCSRMPEWPFWLIPS